MKIKHITIELGKGKELDLTLAQAKELQEQLNDLFSPPPTKVTFPSIPEVYERPFDDPLVPQTWCNA